jgi:diguanylate cyclase (GGDEF)-like protein
MNERSFLFGALRHFVKTLLIRARVRMNKSLSWAFTKRTSSIVKTLGNGATEGHEFPVSLRMTGCSRQSRMGRGVFASIETGGKPRRVAFNVAAVVFLVGAGIVFAAGSLFLQSSEVLPVAIAVLAIPASVLPWMTYRAAESSRALKEAQEVMAKLEVTDPTTRLLNRAGFNEKARALFLESRRKNTPLTAVLIDVDHLDEINRTHGYSAGDAVLQQVADLLGMNIQPGVDLAARYAGAEFVLILPEAEPGWARAFAERLRGALANRPVRFGSDLIPVSASFGVAALAMDDPDPENLISRAAQALRAAKSAGRNTIEVDEAVKIAA